jgi:translation initiation factor 4A
MTDNVKSYEKFEDMGLNEDLLRSIYSYGFEEPSKIQKKGIMPIIEKKNLIAQSQSGTGKTGCFIIGLLQSLINNNKYNVNEAIILSPTRELAIQTNNVATELSKYTKIKNNLFIGGLQNSYTVDNNITIGTPGRIFDLLNRNILPAKNVDIFILDEADEMLSRGFQEQINNILSKLPKTCQLIMFSATIPEDIFNIMNSAMTNPIKLLIQKENLTLEGIRQFFIPMEKEIQKIDTLMDIYKVIKVTQCIIYTNSKKKTEQISHELNKNGFSVNFIHGDIEQSERKEIMNNFRNGIIKILITTDMLSRGIDIQQVSLVINYDLPKEKETYIHRIGRSGRYGRKGSVINFVSHYDITQLKTIESFYNTTIGHLPNDIESVIIT